MAKQGSGIDSITFSTSEGSVTLDKDDAERFLNGSSDSLPSDEVEESEPAVSRYIPGKAAFLGQEWVESAELRELAEDLVGRWPEREERYRR